MSGEINKERETRVVMVEPASANSEDEIDLIELLRLLIDAWKTIVGITILCAGLAVAYALYAPEVFKAEILLAPASEEKSNVSSALGQFGGLAAMAGVSIPADSNKEEVIATLKSRKFIGRFLAEKDLLPVLFENLWDLENEKWLLTEDLEEPTPESAFVSFSSFMSVDENKKTGLVTLSISWKDPQIAADWANDLVRRLNEELRSEAIEDSRKRIGYLKKELTKTTVQDMRDVLYSLLESEEQKAMLANVNEEFALKVLDPAVAPELRESPKRKLIVFLGGVCGVFLGH